MASQTAKVSIQVTGAKALKRALKELGDTEAPFLRQAVDEGGHLLELAVRGMAPGAMAQTVRFVAVRGSGANVKALVRVTHPGAKAMEFGRHTYYKGFTRPLHKGGMKATGTPFQSRGQKARPFVGVMKLDQAIGSVKDEIQTKIEQAFVKEWERIAVEGDSGA